MMDILNRNKNSRSNVYNDNNMRKLLTIYFGVFHLNDQWEKYVIYVRERKTW